MAQQVMVEADGVAHFEMIGRREAGQLPSAHHLDRLEHLQVLARHRERLEPRLVEQDDEWGGAAVQYRDLRSIHLHEGVVHPEAEESGKQVLDGADGNPVTREGGGVVLAREVLEGGRDLDPDVGAEETDPVLGGSGPKGEANGLA